MVKYQLISVSLDCKSKISTCDQSLRVSKHPIHVARSVAASFYSREETKQTENILSLITGHET